MLIGVDYYPEHWDREMWAADADLMQTTGVKLVRLAEFAWCRLEPRDGVFEFEWLDAAIALFAERGIDVVLCTPTSCPPLWLYEKYPDSIMVGKDGRKIHTGIRGHRCVNHPDMLRYVRRIVERMAAHYADNRAVVAWQVDNELEAYFCFCERCNGKFREWLQRRYSSIDELNRAYGNVVWSGEYTSWSQIQPPYGDYPHAWLNPALMLDYYRFASDNVISFRNMQAELIRKNCPGRPVTTNVWFCEHMPDFYREFAELDFISYDNYPPTRLPADTEEPYTHAFHLDMMRGVKRKPFWVMEQLSGGMGCWAPMSRMPEPGMIKGYALQAFAHGADTVLMFRWRTANIGAEMHWHGLLDHNNIPGRRFKEFAELCKVANTLQKFRGSAIKSDVAILMSFENEYAFRIQPQTHGYYYLEQLQRLHAAFAGLGLNVDIIDQHEPLDDYQVVVAPEMYVTDTAVVQHLHEFVAQGGTLVMTTRSGVKDTHNNAIMAPLPTVYRDMVGASVAEYDPIGGDSVPVRFEDGVLCNAKQWCDVLKVEGAQVLACYAGEYFSGQPAITHNSYGSGEVYYIGTVGSQMLYDKLIRELLDRAAIPYVAGLPSHVELVERTDESQTLRFMFNNTAQPQQFKLHDVEISLKPFEMRIDMR